MDNYPNCARKGAEHTTNLSFLDILVHLLSGTQSEPVRIMKLTDKLCGDNLARSWWNLPVHLGLDAACTEFCYHAHPHPVIGNLLFA